MKHLSLLKIVSSLFLIVPAFLYADTPSPKNPLLEEMSAAKLKEALRKSHAEIESRLGSSNIKPNMTEDDPRIKRETYSWLSDKRAYETSIQNKIDVLDYKIHSLEYSRNKDRGAALDDAYRLKNIKIKLQNQLRKIKADNSPGWEINKPTLENLLRDAASA